jgi:hypothetical protein
VALRLFGADRALLDQMSNEVVLSEVSALLELPPGDMEVEVMEAESTSVEGEGGAPPVGEGPGALLKMRIHLLSNASSMFAAGNKMISPAEKATEVRGLVFLVT